MSNLPSDEKDRILQARAQLEQQKLLRQEAQQKAIEEYKNRKHGKLLLIASYMSLILLIVYSVIVFILSLTIREENFFNTLKTFYVGLVKFLLFNLSSSELLISTLSGILTIVTLIITIVLSSSAGTIAKQSLQQYKAKRITIIFYLIFLLLCLVIIFVAVLKWINPLSIIGIVLLLCCIILGITDMIKTGK